MSSECAAILARLDEWLDGDVDSAGRSQIDAHLLTCERCAKEFNRHTGLSAELSSLANIANRIAAAPAKQVRKSYAARTLRIAASLMIAAGTVWFVMRWLPATTPNTPVVPPVQVIQHDEKPPETLIAMADADRFLVTPVASTNPRIHVVWVYDNVAPPDNVSSTQMTQ